MSEEIKATHLVLSLDCGGLERVVLDLVREGRTLGQQVSVLCLERPGALAAQVELLGGSLFCLHKQPVLKLRTINQFKAVLQALRPDVLHAHHAGALVYTGPAARRASVPVVAHTEHGNYLRHRHAGFLGQIRQAALQWVAARHAAWFFSVSKDMANELASRRLVPLRKIEAIPNRIDTDLFERTNGRADIRRVLGIAPDAPVVGTSACWRSTASLAA